MLFIDSDLYFKLFLDSFYSAAILPIHHAWVFFVMSAFGYYEYDIMIVCAISGACLGHILNYMLGRIFVYKVSDKLYIGKYVHILCIVAVLLFSWINIIGSFLCFLAGYFRAQIWYMVFLILLSQMLYYFVI